MREDQFSIYETLQWDINVTMLSLAFFLRDSAGCCVIKTTPVNSETKLTKNLSDRDGGPFILVQTTAGPRADQDTFSPNQHYNLG